MNRTLNAPAKRRDSNMELLRIVAMLLVLIVHANFRALPVPGKAFTLAHPSSAFLMFLTEGFSIVAVNLFVLLSGWYGIRLRANRMAELGFQLLFFGLFAIGCCAVFAPQELTHDVWQRLFLLDGGYWFVKAYVALMLFSPALNAFVEHASRKQVEAVLVGYFAFQLVYDWLSPGTKWIVSGYSLPSFMALYLLARYMRLYPIKCWQWSRWADLGIYLGMVGMLTVGMFLFKMHGMKGGKWYFYTCPLVIIGAMHLLLFFSKIRIAHNRCINWLAISAFACYLTQSSSFLGQFYDQSIRGWFANEPRGSFVLHTALLIAAVFLGSILVDKVRIILWKGLLRLFKRG